MINVGTIGTSWITEEFIEGAQLTELYHIRGIYSRQASKAKALAEKYGADFYCDQLNNLLYDPEIDVIYIASPNSIHFEQAIRALKVGKHVIVEKPCFASVEQWKQAHETAEKNQVMIFEAAKHIHSRNYKRLKQLVRHKQEELKSPFLGANFNLGRYSSKYDAYLKALETGTELPNMFNSDFATGTLMDMGVYPIYVAVDLFGLPETVRYHALTGQKQIDLHGNVILSYSDFQVSIFMSKAVHSQLANEIYFGKETIVIEGITRIAKVALINTQGQYANVIDYKPEHPMLDQLTDFAQIMTEPKKLENQLRYEDWKQLSLQVAQVMAQLRKSAQIEFSVLKDGEK
ncbi:Gfo/Idh/MocA family protein [Vaginisenegalia massiliensis]|uniref:Gfo/Idh/MocA family protein n=1 Tax=Vaginisenegalia massiliensis TaxID=2058294 RepID=UPI000F527BFC|nr:Gfo/Idh/MocA family oxidoreductase [Vaginisenegalia massiliensis]